MARYWARCTDSVDLPTPPLKFWTATTQHGSSAARQGLVPNRPRISLSCASVSPTLRLFSVRGGGGSRPSFSASRSEEHKSELQSLLRNEYAVSCSPHKKQLKNHINTM